MQKGFAQTIKQGFNHRSNKYNFECKTCGCTELYVNDYQNSSYVILSILSKIQSNSDVVDYFKEPPFYNKPIKEPTVKRLKKH